VASAAGLVAALVLLPAPAEKKFSGLDS